MIMVDKTTLDTSDPVSGNNNASIPHQSSNTDDLLPSPTKEMPTAAESLEMQDPAPVPLAKTTKPNKSTKSKTSDSSKAMKNKATGALKTPGKLKETLDKKAQVERLEQDIQNILLWKRPLRSGTYFVLIVSGLLLSKSYSVIQIVSALLTIAIGINLIYVTLTIQTQRILADRPGVNPHSTLLQNDEFTTMDRNSLYRNTELVADVVEAVLQKMGRIVLIEDNTASFKWLMIFYIVWKLSAIISVRTLVTLMTFMLFSVPLLYKYNKNFVDARIHQAQSVCQTHLEQGQNKLQHSWNQLCTRFKLQETGQDTSPMSSRNQRSRKEN